MQRRHRTAHARIWMVLAIALPLIVVVALAMRQTAPADRPAVALDQGAGQ